MTNRRLEQMREIFGQARHLTPKAREALLGRTCGGDAAMLAEIQALLEGDRPATISLDPKTRLPSPPKNIEP
jgi:hypothetical protein